MSEPAGTGALDREHMRRAVTLARRGLYTTDPNPRVGCVIAHGPDVVGEGWHVRAGQAHAEVNALHDAGARARGATVYVSQEPCCHTGRTGPCTEVLIEAGVARVVAAMVDPNPVVSGRGLSRLREAGIETRVGVREEEARALNPGFAMRMRRGRPWVRIKMAMSLDGRTALATGESRWITGTEARHDVHRLRARSSAMLTGIGTLLADDPALTPRLSDFGEDCEVETPLKVVLDSSLRTPPGSNILSPPGRCLIVHREAHPSRSAALEREGAELLRLPGAGGGVDPGALLEILGEREINEVTVECGPTLAGALVAAELADELVIYLAPLLLGDSARGLFTLPGITHMDERTPLEILAIDPVGRDWRVRARRAPRSARQGQDARG